MARSTLELLLESIQTREEQPADELPRLPQRPPSRARLPSSRGRTNLLLRDRNGGSVNGQTAYLQHASAGDGPLQKPGPTSNGHSVEHADSVRFSAQKEVNSTVISNDDASQTTASASQTTKAQQLAEEVSGMNKRKRKYVHVWKKGSKVWFLNQEGRWAQGIIRSVGDMDASISQIDGQQVVNVKHDWVCPANPDILDEVDDLVHLSYVNEPSILHVLQRRYRIGKCYTRAGPLLISTSSTRQQSYEGNLLEPQKQSHPNIHAVVNSALKAMKRDGMSQSIILSGENDIEKMELMKLLMQYLASCGDNAVLGKMLLSLHLILEVFVCTKALDDAEPSYAAEMINLWYDNNGKLSGAECGTVLLEKSRFVSQDNEKQLYKIFYLLCNGANSELKEKLYIKCTSEFNLLNNGIDVSDSSAQLQSVIDSLLLFGINQHDQHYIFTMLAAILWLGNITLPGLNNEALENAAKLLRCSNVDLLGVFSNIEQDPVKVVVARNHLAQSIYECLIQWLIRRINNVLKFEMSGEYKSITLVKMPGFMMSQRKGVDDLLVNYAYENLQRFIQYYLPQLEEQNIICGKGTVVAPQATVIEFLEQEFFPFLDGKLDCRISQMLETLIGNSACCKQKNDHEFSILHSFQEVTYDAAFLLNGGYNFDKPQVQRIVNSCMSWKSDSSTLDVQYDSDGNFFFRCQEWVTQMMRTIKKSVPHFVLCIVFNEPHMANSLHEGSLLKKLQLNRVPETIIALKISCIEKISQNLFADRFNVLLMHNVANSQDALSVCIEVLHKLNVSPYLYRVGLENIFFYPGQIEKLNQARIQLLDGVIAVQKAYRGYKVRLMFKRQKRALTFLQAVVRGWLVRKCFATESAVKREVSIVLEANNIDEGNVSKCDGKEMNGFSTINGIEGDVKQEFYEPRKYQSEGQDDILAALQRREEENAMLQQSIKEYERKWVAYEAKMKSMEEMWMKQLSTLQESLSAADKVEHPIRQPDEHNERDSSLQQSFSENVEANTPHHESNASREPDAARSMISRLSKELEHRTQVFNDDADFLVEVKSGQIEANFKPDEELNKLKQRFEAWKKDFKCRLKDTKNILKKLGKPESAEKKKKTWWGKK